MKVGNWDDTFQVGDLVFSSYHKCERLFKITNIERRFITKDDLRYGAYSGASVGDERSPLVSIVSVAELSMIADSKRKHRKIGATIDVFYLRRATKEHFKAHLDRLHKMIIDLGLK